MTGLSLASLESFERLLEMQIKAGDTSAVLQKKLDAVRVNIADALAAQCCQQILENIV